MKNVVAIIDIGKTNKKIFLFDEKLEVVSVKKVKFEEIKDEDGFPCDDIEEIERWILDEIDRINELDYYRIKAINFSTHGASVLFLDKEGNRLTPLSNYLKPLNVKEFADLYKANGGKKEFSRKTASPAYGMLNAGLQMLRLKRNKPEIWDKVDAILHYPQYLSYLFTKKITADFTSVGAHTATWDFDKMQYHSWLKDEGINLPKPTKGEEVTFVELNGHKVAVGSGLHDSSSSIVPVLKEQDGKNYILLSTGTWIIAMNPFSTEKLSKSQLKNNCLCFMTPEKKQVKSSMQFLGRIHEVYIEEMSKHFKENKKRYTSFYLKEELCRDLICEGARIFLKDGIDDDFEAHPEYLKKFTSYETAYYQLIYEIAKKVVKGINLILDENSELTDVFISGGFRNNEVFIKYLSLMQKKVRIRLSNTQNESAYGAAVIMKDYLKD